MHPFMAYLHDLPRSTILWIVGAGIIILSLSLIVWTEVRALLADKRLVNNTRDFTDKVKRG